MRKSGVKGLGRLLSVLMVAALLMTTAMVPALALDRWEDVVVSVIWTDSQGQQQTTQAFPVPDSAEHAYWATLDASALFSTVQVQVVSSDPVYRECSGVYLMALLMRFTSTCSISWASISAISRSSATLVTMVWRAASWSK